MYVCIKIGQVCDIVAKLSVYFVVVVVVVVAIYMTASINTNKTIKQINFMESFSVIKINASSIWHFCKKNIFKIVKTRVIPIFKAGEMIEIGQVCNIVAKLSVYFVVVVVVVAIYMTASINTNKTIKQINFMESFSVIKINASYIWYFCKKTF